MEESKQDTFSKLVRVLQVNFIDEEKISRPKEEITRKTRLYEDLGMDSFDQAEYLFSVEEVCGIKIPEQKAYKFAELGDWERYIETHPRNG